MLKWKTYKIGPNEVQSTIPFPPYGYRIYLIFTDNLVKTANNLSNQGFLRKNHGIDETTQGATVRLTNQNYVFILLNYNASINEIVHEVYHSLHTMFDWIGAEHEEEIFAYSIGYTVQMVTLDQEIAKKKFEKMKITLDKQKKV